MRALLAKQHGGNPGRGLWGRVRGQEPRHGRTPNMMMASGEKGGMRGWGGKTAHEARHPEPLPHLSVFPHPGAAPANRDCNKDLEATAAQHGHSPWPNVKNLASLSPFLICLLCTELVTWDSRDNGADC